MGADRSGRSAAASGCGVAAASVAAASWTFAIRTIVAKYGRFFLKYVTALMAKGWTRTDIDKGFRGKPDGTTQRMVHPRPRKAEGVKTEKEWFAIA